VADSPEPKAWRQVEIFPLSFPPMGSHAPAP
jgi:hypothetical protein